MPASFFLEALTKIDVSLGGRMTNCSRPMKPEQCDVIWHAALPAVSDDRRRAAVEALGDDNSLDDGVLASGLVNEYLHLEKVHMAHVCV